MESSRRCGAIPTFLVLGEWGEEKEHFQRGEELLKGKIGNEEYTATMLVNTSRMVSYYEKPRNKR